MLFVSSLLRLLRLDSFGRDSTYRDSRLIPLLDYALDHFYPQLPPSVELLTDYHTTRHHYIPVSSLIPDPTTTHITARVDATRLYSRVLFTGFV